MIAAVEDVLSEAIVRRVVATIRPDVTLTAVMGRKGHGYIRSRIRELNKTARAIPVLVLVDLDRPEPCPADLIESWLPSPRAPGLLFRAAVMEAESWVMADRAAFARFLSVPLSLVPEHPDKILQPKERLIALAKRSRNKDLRNDLVPSAGDTRVVGPAYNARLTAFVAGMWSAEAAAVVSPSLRRMVERLRTFV
jgi:hypothetical protein